MFIQWGFYLFKFMKEIKRKIHFFKSSFTKGIGYSNTQVEPTLIFKNIESLSYKETIPDYCKYLLFGDKKYALINCDIKNDGKIFGKIGTIRMDFLPSIENKGKLTKLNLDKDEGIADASHFIYFPEDRILAMEYNFYGPRASTLALYLRAKARSIVDDVVFDFLINKDMEKELQKAENISMLSFKVPQNKISLLKSLDESLHASLESASKLGYAKNYEITIKAVKENKKNFLKSFIEKLPSFLSIVESREAFSKLHLKATDKELNHERTFNLLQDKLEVEEKIVKQGRYREIDSNDMYEKILNAYDIKKDLISRYVD